MLYLLRSVTVTLPSGDEHRYSSGSRGYLSAVPSWRRGRASRRAASRTRRAARRRSWLFLRMPCMLIVIPLPLRSVCTGPTRYSWRQVVPVVSTTKHVMYSVKHIIRDNHLETIQYKRQRPCPAPGGGEFFSLGRARCTRSTRSTSEVSLRVGRHACTHDSLTHYTAWTASPTPYPHRRRQGKAAHMSGYLCTMTGQVVVRWS